MTTVGNGDVDVAARARLTGDLLTSQGGDGGWSAYAGNASHTEATAFALMALAAVPPTPGSVRALEHGASWLESQQQSDGGWPVTGQVAGSTWATAPAALTLALLDRDQEPIRRAVRWLTARRGAGEPWPQRLARWLRGEDRSRELNDLDPSIRGWPWAEHTFSWIEPTSLAILALRASLARAVVADPRATEQRVDEGIRMIVDRATPGGGWNYGNRRILGRDLEPYPDTTAWALLALHRAPVPRGVPARGLRRLDTLTIGTRSPLARALAVLAKRTYGEDTTAPAHALAAQCAERSVDAAPIDTRTRALALLALAGPAHVFEV